MVTERFSIPDIVLCGHIATSYAGRGHVNVARRKCDGRLTAIRMYAIDLVELDELQELRWLRTLRHPHIIDYDSAMVCGSVFHVMHVAYPFGLPEKAIALIARDLLAALVYIHEQKLIHSHLLVNSHGRVRLTGFTHCITVRQKEPTIVSELVHSFDADLTANLLWIAPEILRQNRHGYSMKSDIYSVGITLCEMANGFPPFADMDRLQMLYEKERGTTPRLLDSTTLPEGDQSHVEQRRRRFSNAFHDATDACLKSSAHLRPSAASLLSHAFIRSSRKWRNLADLLPTMRQFAITADTMHVPALLPSTQTPSTTTVNCDVDESAVSGNCRQSMWTFS